MVTPITRTLRITFPLIPASAKNGTKRKEIGRRVLTVKSDKAYADQKSMAAAVLAVTRKLTTWAGNNYVGVEIVVDELAGETHVTVHDLGPQPEKGRRFTKRDVHGVVESVMDALQGTAFDDDRQVRWSRVAYRGWEESE